MKRVLYSLLPSFSIRKVAAWGPYRHLKIGLIADELSSACLARECRTRAVTPLNFKMLFKSWRPDLLFVESAWHGPGNVWKFKIATYPDHPERNNHVLRRVVSYAQDLGIPCVFWNKEDGVHFERFIGSASLFDTIFTVDENCIPRYRAVVPHGTRVHSLMFAVQPAVHSMAGVGPRFSKACFVGSYSHHIHDKRRYWQDMMFSAASELGVAVFDRNSKRRSANYRYPQLPWLEVKKGVPHEATAQIYRDYAISLNVNTVENSPTMFSRRLIEILGCGGVAVTNPALSVERYFKDFCHVVHSEDECKELFDRLRGGPNALDIERARAGAEYVLREHTWAHRLEEVLRVIA